MRMIPEIGDNVSLNKFAFINTSGGTGLSNWQWDEKFTGDATVKVIHAFHDYETGWRYWGTAVSDDLKAYLDRNAGEDKHE